MIRNKHEGDAVFKYIQEKDSQVNVDDATINLKENNTGKRTKNLESSLLFKF